VDWSYPLRAACERNPRRVALRHRGASITFAELDQRVAALVGGLAERGLAGRTVAWTLGNVPDAIALTMALARTGCVAVPVNGRLTAEEIAFVLEDSGASELVGEDGELPVAALAGEPRADWPDVPDDAIASLLYTSGTTGFPKGVVRTHRANAWNVVNSALGSPRAPGDVELFNLPAFGIGLLHFAVPALLGGATVVLDGAFDARRAWTLLAEESVTRTFLAPTMLSAMLDVPGYEEVELPALATIYTAYEFPQRLRERALARFGDRFINMYGLTEAQLTCTRPGEFTAKPGSVGGAMGALRVRVLDASGAAAPPGAAGEIALHGPATMSGYHGRPEESAAALRSGWVLTGDLGRIDEDGDLHYVGRAKEMIKTGGFSVDPREVERALLAHETVAEAAVVGAPDEHWGEAVVAFLVAAPGRDLDADAVVDACRGALAGYKLPKRTVVLDALPVNATGKVERGRLRERAASLSTAPGAPTRSPAAVRPPPGASCR
jgi:acyl-CoA synthetase (AMP-forming)/AMP-acid ligase II